MKSTLRVLLVDLWEGPGHAYYTGPLAAALSRRDELSIGLLHNRHQDLALFPENIQFYPVNAPVGIGPGQWGRILAQPMQFLRTLGAIRRFNPDLLHFVFSYPWFSVSLPLLSRRWPTAATLHDLTPHHGEETLRNRAGIQSAVKYSRALFVHGKHALNQARDLFPSARDRLSRIPLGHCDFLHRHADPGAQPEPATFLFFGRMLRYKGLKTALQALGEVRADHPEARLIIAGAGSLAAEAKQIAALEPNLEIHNRRITEEELGKLMGRSLAALAPYTHSTGSAVVTTSYAFERAVIASRIGSLEDMVIEGETGWLVDAEDAHDLAGAMIRAIEDVDGTLQMGRRARIHARSEWTWERIAEIQHEAYLGAVAQTGQPRN